MMLKTITITQKPKNDIHVCIFCNVAFVTLTKGQTGIVDRSDLSEIAKYKWHASHNGHFFRMATRINRKLIYCHRLLLKLKPSEIGDHINGNTLDNRRANIRQCSHQCNMRNRKKHKNNTNRFKGVHFTGSSYRSTIIVNHKKIHLGNYKTDTEAARAYDQAAKKYFGEFSRLNFPA